MLGMRLCAGMLCRETRSEVSGVGINLVLIAAVVGGGNGYIRCSGQNYIWISTLKWFKIMSWLQYSTRSTGIACVLGA